MKLLFYLIISHSYIAQSFHPFVVNTNRKFTHLFANPNSRVRECRTWIGLKKKKELENTKLFDIDSTLIYNANFDLHEIVDSGSFATNVYLSDNGDVVLTSSNGPDIKESRGSWSVHNKIFRMMIERTYQGRYTEYTIKSHYLGAIEDNTSTDTLIIEGEICDEMCDPDREISVGKFFLITYLSQQQNTYSNLKTLPGPTSTTQNNKRVFTDFH